MEVDSARRVVPHILGGYGGLPSTVTVIVTVTANATATHQLFEASRPLAVVTMKLLLGVAMTGVQAVRPLPRLPTPAQGRPANHPAVNLPGQGLAPALPRARCQAPVAVPADVVGGEVCAVEDAPGVVRHARRPGGDGREAEPVAPVVLGDRRARVVVVVAGARAGSAACAVGGALLAGREEEAGLREGAPRVVPGKVATLAVLQASVLACCCSLEHEKGHLFEHQEIWPWHGCATKISRV